MLRIGNVPTTDLASQFGTPLYVYDAAVIRRQIANVKRSFSALPVRPFYAMKANANIAILRLIRDEGFGCDAVSPGEIYLAKQAGFESKDIWFTCSNVSDDDLLAIHDPDIVINVNSMSEIDRIIALDLPNRIALRVNPDVGAGHHVDVVTAGIGVKFGIDISELASARMVVEDSGRRVVGLHAHIGSGIDHIEPLLESARRLLEVAAEFDHLRWINFGGGISIPYHPEESPFPIDEYGAELTRVADHLLRARGLEAIIEPGRYMVAQSGTLLARVTARRVSYGMTWLGVDTGFNHLARPSKYGAYHHITNCDPRSDGFEDVIVAGNLCESGDVFTRDSQGNVLTRHIERTKVGDLLAFHDAGAYGFSMASHYNARLLPTEVLVEGENVTVIRERQTMNDLVRGMK
jgi:diaminopimelate decarboxylase